MKKYKVGTIVHVKAYDNISVGVVIDVISDPRNTSYCIKWTDDGEMEWYYNNEMARMSPIEPV